MNLCVILVCLFATTSISQAELEYDGKLSVRIEHAFDDDNEEPTFTYRGEIHIRSLYNGAATIEQQQFTDQDLNKLKKLAEVSGNYRIRANVISNDGKITVLHSFLPAKSLLNSKLSDHISIQLDHIGNVVAVSLSSGTEHCSGKLCTQVTVRHMEPGPVPDTASYLQRLEREKQQRDKQQMQDNRNWFQKYWMYIVPIAMFILLSGGSNPDSGAGNQQ